MQRQVKCTFMEAGASWAVAVPGIVPGATNLENGPGVRRARTCQATESDFFCYHACAGMRNAMLCSPGKQTPGNADAKLVKQAKNLCHWHRRCSHCTGGGHACRWHRPRTVHRRLRTRIADWHKAMRSWPAGYRHRSACGSFLHMPHTAGQAD